MPSDRAADQTITQRKAEICPVNEELSAFSAEVKATAYRLWKEAGCRSGKEDECWYKALDQHIRKRVTAEKQMQNPQPQQ